jgi:hypothetical protein
MVCICKTDVRMAQFTPLLPPSKPVEPADERRQPFGKRMFAHADPNIQVGPASIDVSVHEIEE